MSETTDRLDAIEARKNAATPGPWFREYGDVITAHPDPRDVEEGYDDPRNARVVRRAPHLAQKERQGINDAEFIANAPADVAWLLAELRKRDAQLDAVRELAADAAEQPVTELAPVRIFAGFIRTALEAKP